MGYAQVAIDIGRPDDRNMLWRKAKVTWEHMYTHYLNTADYFLGANDDAFIAVRCELVRDSVNVLSISRINDVSIIIQHSVSRQHPGESTKDLGCTSKPLYFVPFRVLYPLRLR